MSGQAAQITYIGHATVVIDMDGTRVLTDPVLRDRVAHLVRHAPPPAPEAVADPDVMLISHLHLVHLDLPSLRRLGRNRHLIVSPGAGSLLRRHGFSHVDEAIPGDSFTVGSLRITATPANHANYRPPFGPRGEALGFIIGGSSRVYFAGDTDLFPGMADLAGTVDIALLPIWGWGRRLGPGHLDPERAARALTLLRPSRVIPIHWGTFAARGVHDQGFLLDPPHHFARQAAALAPAVTVTILQPGESAAMPVPPEPLPPAARPERRPDAGASPGLG
jgi:L-ascorbate metabolism protein UlaG (beta-lactamase superfamily)